MNNKLVFEVKIRLKNYIPPADPRVWQLVDEISRMANSDEISEPLKILLNGLLRELKPINQQMTTQAGRLVAAVESGDKVANAQLTRVWERLQE